MSDEHEPRPGIYLAPGEGRSYPMGRIRALFKADGAETGGAYTISEWWLDPHTKGPGAHSHDEDDVFYVMEGTMSILLGDRWVDAPAGSFVLAPGGLAHDFENRTGQRAGVLNFSTPGDFESHMPAIVEWFAENPPGDAGEPEEGNAATSPEELLQRYEAATAAHDLEATLAFIADDAVYWFSNGASHVGKDAVSEAIRTNFEVIEAEHYALSDVTWLARTPELATCTYRFEWSGLIRGERASGAGRGSSVLARRGEGWLVLHEHLSREG